MKSILYIVLFMFVHTSYGQTYISGKSVITFNSIASSSYLPVTGRIDVQQGYDLHKVLEPGLLKYGGGPTGEFWMHDGMLINLVTRAYDNPSKKKDLEQERLASYPELIYRVGTTPDRSRQLDYFEQIDTINNFEVFIHYYKSKNHKYFLMQDTLGRYIILGEIHCQPTDRTKAHNFIHTLLQSINFN